jgi:hypothetical protein
MKEIVEFKVGNVYLYDAKTKTEYATARIKSTELDAKADQIEVKAGTDNDIQYVIDKPKEVKFNLEDVVQDQNLFALKMGDGMKDADSTVYGFHMPALYKVTTLGSDLIITLTDEPKVGEEVTFQNPITGNQIDNAYVVQDPLNKKIFKVTTVPSIMDGDAIQVGGFKFVGKATDKYFNLTSSSSVPELFAVIEIPLVKLDMSHVCDKQYILPRCKLSASTNVKTESDPKEQDTKHELTVMKPDGEKYLGTVYYKFPTTQTVAPISNLTATSTTAGKIDLTFSAPSGMTNVEVEYKLSTDSNWSECNIGGTTGVRIATSVLETDTSKTILGLSSGTYDVKLSVEDGLYAGTSNVVTGVVVA